MRDLGSVSRLIARLRRQDDAAAVQIWKRYHHRLEGLAKIKLRNSSKTVLDEEDVVIRAFATFLRRTYEGGYESMRDRDDLWKLLATITQSFASKQNRYLLRSKRCVEGFSGPKNSVEDILRRMASKEPSPEFIADMSETLESLFQRLNDRKLCEIALLRLQGCTNEDIAQQQDCSVRTIERRVAIIRRNWSTLLNDQRENKSSI
ncbi:MAG: ECF-type sigma factor [Planctomycetota bacterium]